MVDLEYTGMEGRHVHIRIPFEDFKQKVANAFPESEVVFIPDNEDWIRMHILYDNNHVYTPIRRRQEPHRRKCRWFC